MLTASNRAADENTAEAVAWQCAALFEAATPALFAANAFRVTGLSVDASPREIAQRIAALKLRRLDATADTKRDALSGHLPPTLEQLRDAEYRLRSPAHRLTDEMFWFWPLSESGSKSDAALQAVATGDYGAAERIWKNLAAHPEQGIIAIHNQAVRWLLTALRLENCWKAVDSDDKARRTLSKCWLYALKRWDLQLGDPLLWARIEQRICAIYGPRVSPDLGQQLRKALPSALAGINAALALGHAEKDESSLVLMHVRLIRDGRLIVPAGEYSTMVVERAMKHIRQRLRTATRRQDAEPRRGLDEARDLVRKLAAYDRLFAVLGCVEAPAVPDLIDEGLRVCVDSAAASTKLTDNNIGLLDLLKKAEPLAQSSRMRSLVQGKLDVGRQVVLLPLHTALATVGGGAESPAHRYAGFGRDVLPVLTALLADLPPSEEVRGAAADASARVLRTISIDAWTKARDAHTASAALEDAMKYAVGCSLQSQIYEDLGILTEILSERGVAKRTRPIARAAWCTGALIVCTLVVMMIFNPSKSVSRDSDASLPTVPTTQAVRGLQREPTADSNANATDVTARIYRVSDNEGGELGGDQRIIAKQKELAQQLEAQYRDALLGFQKRDAEANNLERQVHEQSTKNDSEWRQVDNSDTASLEEFRGKVDYYNTLVSGATTAREASNVLSGPLNTLSDRVTAQNAYVNRLIDESNAKARGASH